MATLVDIEQLKRNIREIESSSVYEETSLAEEESKAFKKILKLASIREQASKKLHERLIKDGFSEQAVSNALGRATDAHIVDDERFALDLLREKKILLVSGTGFNWHEPDHFRVVYLPRIEVLKSAMEELADFLTFYHQ